MPQEIFKKAIMMAGGSEVDAPSWTQIAINIGAFVGVSIAAAFGFFRKAKELPPGNDSQDERIAAALERLAKAADEFMRITRDKEDARRIQDEIERASFKYKHDGH